MRLIDQKKQMAKAGIVYVKMKHAYAYLSPDLFMASMQGEEKCKQRCDGEAWRKEISW